MRTYRNSRGWQGRVVMHFAVALPMVLTACKAAPDGGCDPLDPTCGSTVTPPPADMALYVDAARGLDSNTGTREAPFATVQAAIDRATSSQPIRVAGGSYPQALTLRSGVTVVGGYDGATWQQSSQPTFVGAGTPAVTGTNVSGVTLEGLIIQAADATGPGEGSVAMALMGSSVVVRGGRIVAGRGADGTHGRAGSNGANGANGQAGRASVACFPGVTVAGGSGASSGIGRAGGAGGYGSTVNAGNGARGGGPAGGAGGQGGDGVGGIGRNGRTGAAGGSGSRGQDGRGGAELGSFAGVRYAAASGLNGTAGEHGAGGGGGGGGAGSAFVCGASGGGGGAAGAAGGAATGGMGGGASIGVLLSGGSLRLDNGVQVVTANGGRGGDGGRGGNGGRGGAGGAGRSASAAGNSASGGRGGDGGAGGHGGGGGGGPVIGVLQMNGSTLDRGAVTFHLGEPGEAGRGPGNPGQPGIQATSHTMN